MFFREGQKRRLEDRAESPGSIIAPSTTFTGTIDGQDGVQVAGSFKGDIRSQGLVWIGSKGSVDGDVTAPFVIVEGAITGNIKTAEHVEFRSESRINGNVETKKLAIAEGSFFKGEIKMSSRKEQPIHFVEKRKPQNVPEEKP
jgi:cytoskeletal protein CcmA (bactofilin family)